MLACTLLRQTMLAPYQPCWHLTLGAQTMLACTLLRQTMLAPYQSCWHLTLGAQTMLACTLLRQTMLACALLRHCAHGRPKAGAPGIAGSICVMHAATGWGVRGLQRYKEENRSYCRQTLKYKCIKPTYASTHTYTHFHTHKHTS